MWFPFYEKRNMFIKKNNKAKQNKMKRLLPWFSIILSYNYCLMRYNLCIIKFILFVLFYSTKNNEGSEVWSFNLLSKEVLSDWKKRILDQKQMILLLTTVAFAPVFWATVPTAQCKESQMILHTQGGSS